MFFTALLNKNEILSCCTSVRIAIITGCNESEVVLPQYLNQIAPACVLLSIAYVGLEDIEGIENMNRNKSKFVYHNDFKDKIKFINFTTNQYLFKNYLK